MESECQTERTCTSVSPLPSTLLCCSRDDTVCAYCGVSYLVLHEIADLEAKIVLLEQNQAHVPGAKSEADWARGALQAACHALVQRELGDARAKAEARIQSLAEVYEEERREVREQLRQVLDLARSIWDAALRLSERVLPPEQQPLPSCQRGLGSGPVEFLESAALCLSRLDSALRASGEEQQAAVRRARQAETDLVQARVQNVTLQGEVQRLRSEADQLGVRLGVQEQEQAKAVAAARAEALGQLGKAAAARERIRTLTGQAELWRNVARSLESEKVVQERELADLREKLVLARVEPSASASARVPEEEKRRAAAECVSLRGALKDSHEEITALRGQKHALQTALRNMETSSQRGAKERQELLNALHGARQTLRLESERRCAVMADECRRLGEERRCERGTWEQERSRLVAERARAEAESAELRNTCITLQVRAEQCTQELTRLEDTVLKQCEERDTILRTLSLPGPIPLATSEVITAATPEVTPDVTPEASPEVSPAAALRSPPDGDALQESPEENPLPARLPSVGQSALRVPFPPPPPPTELPKIPFTIDAVRPRNTRRTAPSRRVKKSRNNERVRKSE